MEKMLEEGGGPLAGRTVLPTLGGLLITSLESRLDMAGSIPLSVEPDPLGSSLLAVPQCPPVQALESTPAGSAPATSCRKPPRPQ